MLRSESEIVASWEGELSAPKVSVVCVTYNHEKFVEDALRGILVQETNFPIEILIHDDASQDGTQEIIARYKEQYPNLIKCFLQTENQYSQGHTPVMILSEKTKGEYWAICEGDDYWIDKRKLATQVAALELHPEINFSFHPAEQLNFETGETKIIGQYRSDSGVVPLSDVIKKSYGQIPTASTLIRYDALTRYFSFKRKNPYIRVGDIYIHFFGSEPNGAWYVDKVNSVYRFSVPGSWSQKNMHSHVIAVKNKVARVKSFQVLNSLTNGLYSKEIAVVNAKRIKSIARDHYLPISDRFSMVVDNFQGIRLTKKIQYVGWSLVPRSILRKINAIKKQQS